MKKQCLLLAMLLALLCLNQSCNDEPDHVKGPRAVSFSLGLARGGDAPGRIAATIPDGSSVLITLTKPDGTPVLTRERVSILALGNGYVTAPLSLEPGDYTLTDFWIVQDSSAVLFLTPKAGSPMAEYVSRPLPFDFPVAHNTTTNVPIEVVPTGTHAPEDFGYASFTITVVDVPQDTIDFRISVFVENESGGLVLTPAEAVLIRDWESSFAHYDLSAGINTLNFTRSDMESGFRLHINKPGYISAARDISASAIDDYANVPLTVVLQRSAPDNSPSITFGGSTWATGGGYHIVFDFEESATLYVDWGDGFIEKFTPGPGTFVQRHPYETGNEREITVRGDLDKIVSFNTAYSLTSLNVAALVNLKRFSAANSSVNSIDLSTMPRLESLWLALGGGPTILPAEHNIREVFLTYWGEDYTAFVNNIFTNAVNKNIRDGVFQYAYYADDQLPAAVIDKLIILRVDYGWNVSYH
jgi:hypothetical protein